MKNNKNQGAFNKMKRLVNITENFLIAGNSTRARRCFIKAEELLMNGSSEMKCAVSNVFVYSVSSFMQLQNLKVKIFFPQILKEEYYKQAYCSGC